MKTKRPLGCLTSYFAILLSFIVFFPLGIVLLILRGLGEKKLRKNQEMKQKCYGAIVTGNIRYFSQIAATIGKPVDEVKDIVQQMVTEGMLFGAFVDEVRGMIVLPGGNAMGAANMPTMPVENVAVPVQASVEQEVALSMESMASEPALPQERTQEVESAPVAVAMESAAAPVQAPDVGVISQPAPTISQPVQQAVQEEEEKKIPFPRFFFGCALFWMLSILLLGISFGVFGVIVAIVIDMVLAGVFVYDYFTQKKQLYCIPCAYKYDFEDDVDYREVGHWVKTHSYNENSNSSHQCRTSEYFKLEVGCTCQNCGQRKQFNLKYLGRVTYWDGEFKDYDPELEIEKKFQYGIGGSKKDNLLFIALGIICCVISIVVFAL